MATVNDTGDRRERADTADAADAADTAEIGEIGEIGVGLGSGGAPFPPFSVNFLDELLARSWAYRPKRGCTQCLSTDNDFWCGWLREFSAT